LIRSGATGLGGRISVNPSGGLLSRGHPVGATGTAQIVELVQQLRGQCGERQRPGAQVAMAENNGGQIGHDAVLAVTTILSV
jgi:acetyl-CoA acetyltransferase